MSDNFTSVATATSRASKETKLPSAKPSWYKDFQRCRNAGESSSTRKSYIAKSRADHVFPSLSAIDSTAGTGKCKEQTEKQWDTIIKTCKLNGKVSDDMKAAKFFHFGHVIKDSKPAKPSLAFKFQCRLSQEEVKKEIEGLPLPLGNYDAKRRLKILHRRRSGHSRGESEVSLFPSPFSSSRGTHVNEHKDIVLESFQSPVRVHTQQLATQPKPAKLGLDLSYIKHAVEECYNDSELVKGVGKVPVNQKAPEPIAPMDGPWKLSPSAYARKDGRYQLQKMITSDTNINNLMILPSIEPHSLDNDETLQLRWNGITEQTITVFKDHDIKSFAFKDVSRIKYNRLERKLYFEFSSTDPHKLEELLLFLFPMEDQKWMTLQSCCYSLVNGQKRMQHCDSEGVDWFEGKAKSLLNLRIQRPPTIPFPNRHTSQAATRGGHNRRRSKNSSRHLSQTQLETPAKSSNPTSARNSPAAITSHEASSSRDTTINSAFGPDEPGLFDNEQAGIRAPGYMVSTLGTLQSMSEVSGYTEGDIAVFADFPNIENERGAEDLDKQAEDLNIGEGANHVGSIEPEFENQSVAGLYYKPTLRLKAPVSVRLNDLVVRLRSDSERERGGRRDKLDIFDGPWRIVEFAKTIYGINPLSHQDGRDGNASPSNSQYNKTKVKKMLKTKVRLGFPRESQANCWVELNVLHPIVKMDEVHDGKLHASCWHVTELAAFQKLLNEMEDRNLEAFYPKYLSTIMEELEENPDVASELSSEAEDGLDDEAEGSDREDLAMHIVEIKVGIFVAIVEADPKAVDDGDSYVVEKLRAKRLRLFKLNSPEVRKQNLTTDHEDPWVKRLLKEDPHIAVNRIVVSEYKVHWAGWADEDDTWDLGTGNIAKDFIDEFHFLTDSMRNVSLDARMADPRDMVFKDDLPKASKNRASVGSSRSVTSFATSSMVKNKSVQRREEREDSESQDTEMQDTDDDVEFLKAIQASLEDVKAARTQMALEALQNEMGVAREEMETNGNSYNEADSRGIDSTKKHESENDGLDDDSEEACYSEQGDQYELDEE